MLKNTRRVKTLVISRVGLRKAMQKDFHRFMYRSMSLEVLAGKQPFPTANVELFIGKILERLGRKAGEE